ncbi:MAG: AAA family ATPase, partial [Clostridiales bacterium]|nr:AAA family ATPase [Clostridiales bacterium]
MVMNMGTQEAMTNKKLYEYYSSVSSTKVEWLWYPYIPFGKITLLQGDPGDGKSTLALNIAAAVTKGSSLPDDMKLEKPLNVIYQCPEDGSSATIKPRLMCAGADCSRIVYIVDAEERLTLDDPRIEKTVADTGARLLVLDPLQSFLRQDGEMQSAGKM